MNEAEDKGTQSAPVDPVVDRAVYPHQSLKMWAFIGVVIIAIGGAIMLGGILGWFNPPPPVITQGIWETTQSEFIAPTILGVNPVLLGTVLVLSGLITEAIVLVSVPTYCQYCGRRID